MLTVRRYITLPIVALVIVGCSTPTGAPDPHAVIVEKTVATGDVTCTATTAQTNRQSAVSTNVVRSQAGLPPLRANMLLAQAASHHACDMAMRGQMTHKGSRTTGPSQRVKALGYSPMITAENIAAGPFDRQRVMREWRVSKGHLDNILLPQVNEFGIGHAVGADGKTQYWAAVYAAAK
jgi:uncharacterized protein YkwD